MSNSFFESEIKRLYADNFSYSQIAEILGCAKSTVSYHVGESQKEKSRKRGQHTKAVRKEKVGQTKMKPCKVCGLVPVDPCQMDYDHLDATQKVAGVNQMIKNYSWEKTMLEIEKCQLICSNCHRLLTKRREYAKKNISLFEDIFGPLGL